MGNPDTVRRTHPDTVRLGKAKGGRTHAPSIEGVSGRLSDRDREQLALFAAGDRVHAPLGARLEDDHEPIDDLTPEQLDAIYANEPLEVAE